jgi:transcription termination factor Rho
MTLQIMKLQDLKTKSPAALLELAEELKIENASAMRKQDMMFAILKQLAEQEVEITGGGVVEVLPDGFGFLRAPESNYLPGPDDIYVSSRSTTSISKTPRSRSTRFTSTI